MAGGVERLEKHYVGAGFALTGLDAVDGRWRVGELDGRQSRGRGLLGLSMKMAAAHAGASWSRAARTVTFGLT